MPKPWADAAGTAMSWWRTVSEVNPGVIVSESMRDVRLAIIGDVEETDRVYQRLTAGSATDLIDQFLDPPDQATSGKYAFRLYVTKENALVGIRDSNSLSFTGTFEMCTFRMMELRPDLAVALGRRFPGLRQASSQWIIKSVALANLQFAMLSAIPGILPITAPFLPASSFADLVVLTKNQTMMVLRLGAIYGEKPGITTQVREILSTVGAAFGWRTIARQAAGFVPAGAGVALKGAIAWTGTIAVGKVAEIHYQRGYKVTLREARNAAAMPTEEVVDLAKRVAQDVSGRSEIDPI